VQLIDPLTPATGWKVKHFALSQVQMMTFMSGSAVNVTNKLFSLMGEKAQDTNSFEL
jgi:hypothetical protein